jgi:hypothetical protein
MAEEADNVEFDATAFWRDIQPKRDKGDSADSDDDDDIFYAMVTGVRRPRRPRPVAPPRPRLRDVIAELTTGFERLRQKLRAATQTSEVFAVLRTFSVSVLQLGVHFQMGSVGMLGRRHRSVTTSAELNAASERDPWTPFTFDEPLPKAIGIEYSWLPDALRQHGLGRHILNVLQQAATENDAVPQYLRRLECHFPAFYTVDSHYNWARTKLIAKGTPAGRIFPRYLLTDGDPAKEAVNEEADQKYTDLEWLTPLEQGRARVRHLSFPHSVETALQELNYVLAHPVALAAQHPGVRIMPIRHALLATNDSALAVAVAGHCQKLGNCDTAGEPLALRVNDVLFMHWEVFLAFLIDHCRVMYRPIVLRKHTVDALCAAAKRDSLDAVIASSAVMPRPRPYFTPIDSEHWLWVPVKKPHSSSYDGRTYYPLPENESEPAMVAELLPDASERPSKRARTFQCMHCGQSQRALAGGFCDSVCRVDYYYDEAAI